MDLKRCRAQTKNKSLVNSTATYIKLLDYAERLEKDLETTTAVCDSRGDKIQDLIELCNKLKFGLKAIQRCEIECVNYGESGELINDNDGEYIRYADLLKAIDNAE